MERMTHDEALKWLEADEAASRPYRAERMHLLLDLFGQNKNMLFFGGPVPAQAFEEMRLAYLHGLYISCVVVSQIVIEQILTGLLNLSARTDIKGAGFQKLTEEALAGGYISQTDFDNLNRVRRLRNPYSHSKPVTHQSSLVRRAARTGSHPIDLFKEDAERAPAVVAALLVKYPSSLPDEEELDGRSGSSRGSAEDEGN